MLPPAKTPLSNDGECRRRHIGGRGRTGRGGIGGFGGLFRFDPTGWRDPILVSSSDGVGTKVELARQLDRLDGIGHDLVGMVVDDLVAVGARPLFMNDYLAVGRLDPQRVADLVGGIADAGADIINSPGDDDEGSQF